MAALTGIKDIVDAELAGKMRDYIYRKTPSQATTQGIWFDTSMSPGMPTPKYWFDAAPLTARAITQSADGGFYHGPNVSPSEKYLRMVTINGISSSTTTPCPMPAILCDYIMYYPTIDDGTTDEQVMDNTVTLPRYSDGKGVQMIVVTTGARVGGQTFTIKYTNQDGVTGRVTPLLTQNTSTILGSLTNTNQAVANGAGPFVPLAYGDSGVRAVESVTMNGVDVGLFSIILVKPLTQLTLREIAISTAATIGVPYEKDLLMHDNILPRIYDDAFLNYLVLPLASVATTTITGSLKVIWN
jgi:hypothetical protein